MEKTILATAQAMKEMLSTLDLEIKTLQTKREAVSKALSELTKMQKVKPEDAKKVMPKVQILMDTMVKLNQSSWKLSQTYATRAKTADKAFKQMTAIVKG